MNSIRYIFLIIFGLMAMGFIYVVSNNIEEFYANLLFDKGGVMFPFSVQNIMWVIFFVGFGELLFRFYDVRIEMKYLDNHYLPEEEEVVLVADDVAKIYQSMKERGEVSDRFLLKLIQRCILQFQTSGSIDQSANLLNTSVEIFIQEIDIKYTLSRYINWLIPSMGFIGTVIGIGLALSYAGAPGNIDDSTFMTEVTSRLAVAFNSTMLALLMASVLVFFQSIIQAKEERILLESAQYCLDNLINRLYVSKE